MRRFLLAVAALLVVTATPALAGYLVIRVLLDGGGGGPAAAPGGPGFAGPGPGIRGGGEGGPGPGGPGGLGRRFGGGGTPGMPGPGMPGPGLGGQPGFTGAAEEHGDPSRSVVVVIPFEKLPGQKNFYKPGHGGQNPPWPFALDHPLGHTNLFTDGQTIQWYLDFVQVPERGKTKQSDIRARRTAWGRNPADAQPLLNLVNEALENGMVKEAVAYSDDLLAAFKADKRVTKFGEDPQRFVERYEKLRPRITGSAAPRPDADDWKRRLGATGLRHQGHYTLLSSGASDAEQTRRLTQLDDNFKAFFLWHLTRGIELNVPTVTQLAVLAPDSERVIPLARALDVLGAYSAADKVEKSEKSEKGEKPARALERLLMPADAFYAPDYDLLVLSPERLDSVGQTFRAQNQSIYREGFNRAELTGGGGPKLGPDPRNPLSPGRQPEDVARMQTLAAVEAYLQEEGELSAVSREGSHQLLYAAGLLPRHVSAPTWLVNGAADFFHRPKGPVFTTREDKLAAKDESKTFVTVALTTGYGVPNYVLHKHFKEMIARKELMTRGDPEALLRNVLSDAYYAALREGDELDAPPPPPPTTNLPRAGATTQPGYGPQPGLGGPGRSGSAPPTGEGGPGPGGPGFGRPGGPGPFGAQPGFGIGVPGEEDASVLARRKRERMVNKARASSWALYFYLARTDPAGLRRYFDELKKLPRDLPLDEKAAVETFARALHLSTGKAAEAGKRPLKEFAAAWVNSVKAEPLHGVEFHLKTPDSRPVDPTRPFGPGGFPGFPGAGGPGGEGP